jgi:hypothetical protein
MIKADINSRNDMMFYEDMAQFGAVCSPVEEKWSPFPAILVLLQGVT